MAIVKQIHLSSPGGGARVSHTHLAVYGETT